jgi:two-component system, OmpR family, response regulator
MRILLAEDDPLIARDVAAHLASAGYLVRHVADGETAWHLGDTEDFSAAVLDLGLPTLDGMQVLKRWRAAGRDMPVLILTARGNWEERVEGIDAGADDYLPKPFRMLELLARLRAIMRRYAGQAGTMLACGPIEIDTKNKAVFLHGVPALLSALEYRCVSVLAMNAGRPVSQVELTEQLYEQDFERDSNSIEVLITRLRRKLGRETILTKRGFGYQLTTSE